MQLLCSQLSFKRRKEVNSDLKWRREIWSTKLLLLSFRRSVSLRSANKLLIAVRVPLPITAYIYMMCSGVLVAMSNCTCYTHTHRPMNRDQKAEMNEERERETQKQRKKLFEICLLCCFAYTNFSRPNWAFQCKYNGSYSKCRHTWNARIRTQAHSAYFHQRERKKNIFIYCFNDCICSSCRRENSITLVSSEVGTWRGRHMKWGKM